MEHLSSWKQTIESALAARDVDGDHDMSTAHAAFESFLEALESGECRAASPDASGHWHVARDVKQLILYGFRLGRLVESHSHDAHFCDKHNLWPAQQSLATRGIRIVPGGTAVRRGAFLGAGVTIMAPAYVNIGAYIGRGTMIDSHVTVGSCAQVGENCHISAAAQLGGVLEPVGALPVIVEDTAFIGGNSGVYEGTHIHRGAVIATGTSSTKPSFAPSMASSTSPKTPSSFPALAPSTRHLPAKTASASTPPSSSNIATIKQPPPSSSNRSCAKIRRFLRAFCRFLLIF